jgi:pilus assembly protein Flp/PilA
MPKPGVWPAGLQKQGTMRALLHRFIGDKSGVTAIEYGLIASLIAVAVIVAVQTLGTNLQTVFGQVAGSLT